ncbi:hypothetical protein ACOME3_009737 [Neoechinorhynchus agilis]
MPNSNDSLEQHRVQGRFDQCKRSDVNVPDLIISGFLSIYKGEYWIRGFVTHKHIFSVCFEDFGICRRRWKACQCRLYSNSLFMCYESLVSEPTVCLHLKVVVSLILSV